VIFGNSLKTSWENMLFLFVQHSFDVGDVLELEGGAVSSVPCALAAVWLRGMVLSAWVWVRWVRPRPPPLGAALGASPARVGRMGMRPPDAICFIYTAIAVPHM
jgi:hypothetical protein